MGGKGWNVKEENRFQSSGAVKSNTMQKKGDLSSASLFGPHLALRLFEPQMNFCFKDDPIFSLLKVHHLK